MARGKSLAMRVRFFPFLVLVFFFFGSLVSDLSIVFNPRDIDIDAFEKDMIRCTDYIAIAMKNRELLEQFEDRLVALNADIVAHADVYREVDEEKVTAC